MNGGELSILKPIVKLNILDNISSVSYIFAASVFVLIGCFMIINQSVNLNNWIETPFVLSYTFYIFQFTTFMMVISTVLGGIGISEKASGRLEFYLANSVSVRRVLSAYTISTVLLSLLPILLLNLIVLAFSLITNNMIIITILYNELSVLAFSGLIILSVAVSLLMNIIVLVINKPQIVRVIIMMLSMTLIYAAQFPVSMVMQAIALTCNTISVTFSLCFVLLAVICIFVSELLKGKLSKEAIVLSIRH